MIFSQLKKWTLKLIEGTTFVVSSAVILLVVYKFGYPQTNHSHELIRKAFDALLIVQWVGITMRLVLNGSVGASATKGFKTILYVLFSTVTLALLVLQFKLLQPDNFLKTLTSQWAVIVVSMIIAIVELSRIITTVLGKKTNPAMILAVSFAVVIFIGSLLLGLPNCAVRELSYIDSLFVSASAVCVTGLTPIDVASTLTMTGQIVLLALIQVGGLGIMTLTSFFGLFFVNGSFANQIVVKDLLSSDKMNGLLKYALRIIIVAFTVEAAGALMIYLSMIANTPMEHGEALFFSVFHAVSAFCNAGFSTLSGNLYDPAVRDITSVIWIISWLVIFGGIGFPIFNNLIQTIGHKIGNLFRKMVGMRMKVRKHLWKLNTYIVVKTTVILLAFGWGFFLIVEWNNALAQYSFFDKLAQGFLMAVTPRTAGFNGVDISTMMPASIFVTMILMWIGGAPQSTAGGIKVTTFYLALRNVLSTSPMHERIEVKGREIPQTSVRRALGVIFASLVVIAVSIVALSIIEPTIDLMKLCFEVVSAIGTVGMSNGVTPQLSTASKAIVIALMFIGRVGIVSILLTFLKNTTKTKHYKLPEENILIN